MSASDIQLNPSRYAKALLGVAAILPLLIMATVALSAMWQLAMLPVLLLFYWQWWVMWQQLQTAASFTLTTQGELHFVAPYRKVQLTGGLICNQAVLLRGNMAGSETSFQYWVFADQCSDMQFRALARAINQCNWQAQQD